MFIARSILNFLLPQNCIFCGSVLSAIDKNCVCQYCQNTLQIYSGKACERCGAPLAAIDINGCEECQDANPAFDRIFWLFLYDERVRRMIQQFKYQKDRSVRKIIADILYRRTIRFPWQDTKYDCVIPVPLHQKRLKNRGFNQAEDLAKIICRHLKQPRLLKRNILSRTKNTMAQNKLSRSQREANLAGAFSIKSPHREKHKPHPLLSGKTVLLIDDIFTTGSTLNQCARVLKEKGALKVDALTISRAF